MAAPTRSDISSRPTPQATAYIAATEERDPMTILDPTRIAIILLSLAIPLTRAVGDSIPPDLQTFRQIYQELVEIDTTESTGDTVKAAEAMAARLRTAGLPAEDVQVLTSGPRKGNLVARLHGNGARRPMLLLAHIDVVEAKSADWGFDPFRLQEIDGYLRGRGTIDDKAMASIFVANMIAYLREGFRPERDIILALTADEELSDSPHDGAHWLLNHHRNLIDAEFAINEGGGGVLRNGKPSRMSVQLAEKVYQSFRLEVKDPGGHSANPRRDNPIYLLARALDRLAQYDFPIRLNPVTRAYFERVIATEENELAAAIQALLAGHSDPTMLAPLTSRPGFNAQLRTTCVATLLDAGHAENALPQTARATINCRVLPDQDVDEVRRTLIDLIGDMRIAVTAIGKPVLSPPSPLDPMIMHTIEAVAGELFAGAPVIPTMSGGYTDSRWLRNAGIPSYGVSGLFTDQGNTGVHGLNEQVRIVDLYNSKDFLYRLVKRLAAPGFDPAR
jgi:acetylornithine deacetylase/succinyl-diaminopimelate desuccinylase-like protein